jgi:hypothetical protein
MKIRQGILILAGGATLALASGAQAHIGQSAASHSLTKAQRSALSQFWRLQGLGGVGVYTAGDTTRVSAVKAGIGPYAYLGSTAPVGP